MIENEGFIFLLNYLLGLTLKYNCKDFKPMVSISEIIKAFKRCYNSFEICSVIYDDGKSWHNVLTSFYLSKDIIENTKENIVFDGDNIKIVIIQMSHSCLQKHLEDLKKGQIYIKGLQVQFENPFDYDTLKIREDTYAHYRQTEGSRTFIFERNFNVFNNNNLIKKHLDLNTEVIKLGFIDIFDFISHYAGIRSYSPSYSHDFLMIIPVFFSINSTKVENGELNIDLGYSNEFNDLQINVIGYKEDNITKIFRENKEIKDNRKINFSVQSVLPDSKLDIYLFSRSLPELQVKETIYVPINQPLLPFTQTYNQFHKLEELELILTKPETLDSKARSSLYEKAVCDLFSLCGLSAIHLKDHEILQLKNKTKIGSADILAYDGSENLFVIDCDIMVPDPKKMVNLIYLCRYLSSVTTVNEIKNIIPIIISPSAPTTDDTDVLVIDGGMIHQLFKGIHYKSKYELVSMITKLYFLHQAKHIGIHFR
jgi:hypothetical protein